MKKRMLSLFLALAMVFGMIPAINLTANAATVTASGDCGENATWSLDSDGVLTVSGTGVMTDYTSVATPWQS